MADISKISNGTTTYNIKDEYARKVLNGEEGDLSTLSGNETYTGKKIFSNTNGVTISSTDGGNIVLQNTNLAYVEGTTYNALNNSIVAYDKDGAVIGTIFLGTTSKGGKVSYTGYNSAGSSSQYPIFSLAEDKTNSTLTLTATGINKIYSPAIANAQMPGDTATTLPTVTSSAYVNFGTSSEPAYTPSYAGWLCLSATSSAAGNYIKMYTCMSSSSGSNPSEIIGTKSIATAASQDMNIILPVSTTVKVYVLYTTSTPTLKFISCIGNNA